VNDLVDEANQRRAIARALAFAAAHHGDVEAQRSASMARQALALLDQRKTL